MPVASPSVTKKAVEEVVKALVEASVERPPLPPPAEVKTEHRFLDAPPDTAKLSMSSVMLDEIKNRSAALGHLTGPERQQAEEDLRGLIDRYKTLTGSAKSTTVEVGVDVEKAPTGVKAVHAVASRTLGRPVADVLVDRRDTEVHYMQRSGQPDVETVDESVLENLPEGQQKAASILNGIKSAKKPEEVAALVSELSTLEDTYGGGLLRNPEVGDFARQVETSINAELRGKAGSSADAAEAAGRTMGEKTLLAEHRAVYESDMKGAAAQMEEVSRESVSYGEALARIESLKDQAAYFALAGDNEKAGEKLAEMTVVSSSMPSSVPEAAVKQTVMLPKNPDAILNGIEQADGLDAHGALKVISRMDELAREAKEAGAVNVDVAQIHAAVMKEIAQKKQAGQSTSISGMLDDPAGRQRILEAIGKES